MLNRFKNLTTISLSDLELSELSFQGRFSNGKLTLGLTSDSFPASSRERASSSGSMCARPVALPALN